MNNFTRIFSILFIFIVFLQYSAVDNYAESDTSQFKILGSIGGPTNTVAVNGEYVFVGKGTSIIVLKNTGGSLRQEGSQLKLPSFVSDLKADGKILYAAAGSAGLHIIDISDPLKPTIKGVYKTRGFAEAVAIKGNIAYLANGIEGLQLVDVSDTANPQAMGQAWKGKYAFSVAVSGNYAYLAAGDDGLLIVDISQGSTLKEISACDTPGVARNVAVSGKYAFVADDWKGVSVVDISKSQAPVLAKFINTAGRAHGLALVRNLLYVADAYMGLRVFDVSDISASKELTSFIPAESQMIRVVADNGTLYCADRSNGVLCFDINKPAVLDLKGFYSHTIPIPQTLPDELSYWDNANQIARLVVLGVLDGSKINPDKELTRAEYAVMLCKAVKASESPKNLKSRFPDVPNTHWAFGYIESAVRLGLIKTKNKSFFSPEDTMSYGEVVSSLLRLVNREPKTGTWPANCIREAESLGINTVLCRSDMTGTVNRGNTLAMLEKVITEITDSKTKVTLLQSKFGIELQAFPMECIQVAAKGNYAYATCGKGGLSVLDIQNPKNIRQVAHVDFPEQVDHIRIYENLVYLPTKNKLFVVDITNPANPVCIYFINMVHPNGPPRGVDINKNFMYIADEWGFKIISLKNSARPVLVKNIRTMGEGFGFVNATSDIAVRDGIAYISNAFDGILLYDVSDVKNPKYIKTYKSDDNNIFSCNIHFAGNLALDVIGNPISILDISDINNPKKIGKLTDIYASQFYAEIGCYKKFIVFPNDSKGIAVADFSDPANVKNIEYIDTSGVVSSVFVEDSFVYIADGLGGMCIVSLSEKKPPETGNKNSKNIKTENKLFSFKTNMFVGLPAEKYVLSTEKALKVLKNQPKSFSQTLTVSNTNDTGKGSLRWCMENIKKAGRILFDTNIFNPAKPGTIYSKSTLEFFTDKVTIDASNAGVIIEGSASTDGSCGLYVNTKGNVIRGLKIQNFKGDSVNISGGNNIIGGSRLKGKGPTGEGNVFINSGGFWISGPAPNDNIVVGNNFGVDSDGKSPAGNTGGLNVRGNATRNIIGMDIPEYRNIIANNKDKGLSSMGSTFGNLIEGNYIGTDITGTKPMGNYDSGISFELCGYGSIVRNNISCSNGRNGILIWDGGGNYNVIIGNSIGIGADNITLLPNKEGPTASGGGVGGACFYNIYGGTDKSLQNRIYSIHESQIPITPGIGLYETMVDGKVYKYADTNGY